MKGVLQLLHIRKQRIESNNPDAPDEDVEKNIDSDVEIAPSLKKEVLSTKESGATTGKIVTKVDDEVEEVKPEPSLISNSKVNKKRKPVSQATPKEKSSRQAAPKNTPSLLGFFAKKEEVAPASSSSAETIGATPDLKCSELEIVTETTNSVQFVTPSPVPSEVMREWRNARAESISIVPAESNDEDSAKSKTENVSAESQTVIPLDESVQFIEEKPSEVVAETPATASAPLASETVETQPTDPHPTAPTMNSNVAVTPIGASTAPALPVAPVKKPQKQKELSSENVEVMCSLIRSAGSKSKEVLVKELRAAIPLASEKMITSKLTEIALKAKWDSTSQKTWQLKADLTPEQLEMGLNQQPQSGGKVTKAPNQEPPTSTTEASPPEVAATNVLAAAQKNVEAPQATPQQSVPIVAPAPVEQPEDPRLVAVKSEAARLLGESKGLFQEIFDNVESVRDSSVLLDLAKAVSEEMFEEKLPPESAMKLIAVIVHDARKLNKSELCAQVCQVLSEAHEGKAPTNGVMESWMDLCAKRVDYFDDWFTFEMERKNLDEKAGKARRIALRNLTFVVKALLKVEKDLTNQGLKACDRSETALKDIPERIAKVQREWFNREKDIPTTIAKKHAVAASDKSIATANASNKNQLDKATASTASHEEKNSLFKFFGAPKSSSSSSSGATATTEPAPSKTNDSVAVTASNAVVVADAKEENHNILPQDIIELSKESIIVAEESKKPAKSNRTRRTCVLFVDSRTRIKKFKRDTDDPAYFGRSHDLNGRRWLGRVGCVDYEIDSEDEEGESLASEGDEEEEGEEGLDFEDGFLEKDEDLIAAETNPEVPTLERVTPVVVGVTFSAKQVAGGGPVEVSVGNQPFTPVQGMDVNILLRFPVIARKRTLEECTNVREAQQQLQQQSTDQGTPSGKDGSNNKKRPKAVFELVGDSLKTLVEVVEGSLLPKPVLINEIVEALRSPPDYLVPSKTQVENKVNEIAEKNGKRGWVVKKDVLSTVGVNRKASGSVCVYDHRKIMEDFKSKGVENPSEFQIKAAEKKLYLDKMEALKKDREEKKKINAAIAAANDSNKSTFKETDPVVPNVTTTATPSAKKSTNENNKEVVVMIDDEEGL